jgi:Xaa-Pro aminopeptidase
MIQEKEYKKRRDKLSAKLVKNSITLIFSADQKTRSNDTEFPYRQDSNFYYLTGFKEDNSALVIVKKSKKIKTYLFVEHKDEALELWHGKRLGEKEAKKRFLVDDVFVISDLKVKLKEFIKNKSTLYYDFTLEAKKVKTLSYCTKRLSRSKDVALLIQRMRLIKSKAEIELIKKAISITKEAHHRAMELHKRDKYEYELQAEIEYTFKSKGAYSDAYTSIVACGNAANTLHYISNDQALVKGKLILIDAGCEYQYYASDITRTIPVDKKYSKAQAELYNMVLDVQLKIIKMIKPAILRSDLQKKAIELLSQGLLDLGILKGSLKQIIKKEIYKKYYPHGIGHWMGIDVHDQSPYKYENGQEIPLKKGMVITIEPAIYIDESDTKVPKKYRGIGIRIEDDILVTKDGYENLSSGIAKTIQEIEKRSK